MSSLETENLLQELKMQLGIEANIEGQKLAGSNNRKLCIDTEKKGRLPPTPPNRKTLQNIKEMTKKKRGEDKLLDDLSEKQISELLREASLDSDTVNSVMDIIAKDPGRRPYA